MVAAVDVIIEKAVIVAIAATLNVAVDVAVDVAVVALLIEVIVSIHHCNVIIHYQSHIRRH